MRTTLLLTADFIAERTVSERIESIAEHLEAAYWLKGYGYLAKAEQVANTLPWPECNRAMLLVEWVRGEVSKGWQVVSLGVREG